jgi:hypothetical protein
LNFEILKSFEISSTDSASGGIRRVADGEIGGSSFEILKSLEINLTDDEAERAPQRGQGEWQVQALRNSKVGR